MTWGDPRPTDMLPEEINSGNHAVQASYSPKNQEVPVDHRTDPASKSDGWKNGWTAPLGYDEWMYGHEQYSEQPASTQNHEYQDHDRLPTSSGEEEPKENSSYGYPGPLPEFSLETDAYPTASSSFALAQLLTSFEMMTFPKPTSTPSMLHALHHHSQLLNPTFSSSDKTYSAPITIHETRTFTYSYLEKGTNKLAVTTLVGHWKIEPPAVAVSTVWVTIWMDDNSATEVSATTSLTSGDLTQTDRTSSSTAKPLTPFRFGKSTSGKCGVFADMLTCEGTNFGRCCSQFGWCGGSSMHCGDGCQRDFGECNPGVKSVNMPSFTSRSTSKGTTSTCTADASNPSFSTAEESTSMPVYVVRPTTTVTVGDSGISLQQPNIDTVQIPAHDAPVTLISAGKQHKTLKEILEELYHSTHGLHRSTDKDEEE
jgi:hypothetical protein